VAGKVSVHLFEAEYEARRYVLAQRAEANRLGFPSITAFFKNRSLGSVSAAPLPDDPKMDITARFMQVCDVIEQAVIDSRYGDEGTIAEKARALRRQYPDSGMNYDMYNNIKKSVLGALAKHLKTFHL
jgi:hypothetical protein